MDYHLLIKAPIFHGISIPEAEAMLQCLPAFSKYYENGDVIYRAGGYVNDMGLVLTGSVHIESMDVWGNRNILEHIGPGQVFAETYACIPEEPLMVSAVSVGNTEILFLPVGKLLTPCSSACPRHTKLIRNLLAASAQKNLALTRKIFHTAPKSIRGKLLSYLSAQAIQTGSNQFEIPFNRQQLADYLEVDRSALSNELSKMRQDGLLTYKKNRFCLIKQKNT